MYTYTTQKSAKQPCFVNILDQQTSNEREFISEDETEIKLNLNVNVDGVTQTKSVLIPLNGAISKAKSRGK